MKIVFVCAGNTCRSPLALAAWHALQKQGQAPPEWEATSAGLLAGDGMAAAKYSVAIAKQWGEDLSSHRSQLLTDEMARQADAIFVMSQDQALALRDHFQIAPETIHMLGDFDEQEKSEVLDPVGGSREAYETCAAKIHRGVQGLADAIERGEIGN